MATHYDVQHTTTYRYRDYASRGSHQWNVRAVVNGKTSASTAATATVDFRGTWLFDEDGRSVCIQDDKDHAMTMPEASAVHAPLGSDRAIIITQALRGYEGDITGLITRLVGQSESVATWRANLLDFKSEPYAVRTLVMEDLAMPVVIRNVQLRGAPKRDGYLASYEFYQQGDLLFDPLED